MDGQSLPEDPAFSTGGRPFLKRMYLFIELKSNINRISFLIFSKSSFKSIFKVRRLDIQFNKIYIQRKRGLPVSKKKTNATSKSLQSTSKSKSKKTNIASPREDAKRGPRPLLYDENGKLIRTPVVANNANSV